MSDDDTVSADANRNDILTPQQPSQITKLIRTLDQKFLPKLQQQHQHHPLNLNLNLKAYTNQELDELLSEVRETLEELDAEKLFREAQEQVQDNQAGGIVDNKKLWPIHDEIIPKLRDDLKDHCIRYIHICEYPKLFSVGIFVFPPGR